MLIDWIKSQWMKVSANKREKCIELASSSNHIPIQHDTYDTNKTDTYHQNITYLYGNDAQITYLIRTKRQKKSMLWSDLISRSFANQKHSIRCIDLCLCVAHINISTKSVYNVQHISISIWCDKKKKKQYEWIFCRKVNGVARKIFVYDFVCVWARDDK